MSQLEDFKKCLCLKPLPVRRVIDQDALQRGLNWSFVVDFLVPSCVMKADLNEFQFMQGLAKCSAQRRLQSVTALITV